MVEDEDLTPATAPSRNHNHQGISLIPQHYARLFRVSRAFASRMAPAQSHASRRR